MLMEGAGCRAVVVEEGRGGRYTLSRRGGRVVECGGLENRYVGNPGVEGSNPSLSAAVDSLFGFRFLVSGSPGCAD